LAAQALGRIRDLEVQRFIATLLLILFAAPAQAVITVVLIVDDVSRFGVGAYRTAGVDTVTVGTTVHATTNLDAIAAAGVRMDLMRAHMICTPFGAEFATGKFVNRPSNGMGDVKDGEFPATIVPEIAVGAPNIWNMAKAAGSATAHFGKWHLGLITRRSQFGNQTMLSAMGIDYYDEVVQRNCNHANPLTDAEYTASTGFEPECKGHYSCVRMDSTDAVIITTDYSGDVEFDTAEAYITAWAAANPGDDLLVTFAPTAPHNPVADGSGSESCVGGNPVDDRPPAPWNTGEGDNQVYYDMIAALDANIGGLRTVLSATGEQTRLIVVADNGTPNGRTLPTELNASKGSKNTIYPLGVFVPMIAEGFDIEVGVMTGLYATPDLTATVAELIGARNPHRDGTSFAGCWRETGTLTAANCPDRDYVWESRWAPLGGSTGLVDRRPIPGDNTGTCNRSEDWIYTTVPDDTLRLLGRYRDCDASNFAYREEFWEVPLTGANQYIPASGYNALATNSAGDNDLVEGDFLSAATPDELTALSESQALLTQLVGNSGDHAKAGKSAGR
jgi:arylsulfatase A-like enzyme